MLSLLLGRLLQSLGIVVAMSVMVFIGISVVGNPVDVLISPEASAEERAQIIAALELDQPLWVQYLNFIGSLVQGNFGHSFVFGVPAITLIMQRLPATLELAVAALVVSIVVGLPLGVWAGLRPKAISSRLIMSFSILGFSLPTFWIGIMMMMLFSVVLGWLPATGRGDTVPIFGIGFSFLTLDGLQHLVLPAATLALLKTSLVIRLARAGVEEIMYQDFIRFARAKGISYRRMIYVHVLRNILIPIVTVMGMEFSHLIAFSLVTETIFAWPGMGKLIFDSIQNLDRPIVVAYLMIVVVLVSGINLIVDILYMLIDPRTRRRSMS